MPKGCRVSFGVMKTFEWGGECTPVSILKVIELYSLPEWILWYGTHKAI